MPRLFFLTLLLAIFVPAALSAQVNLSGTVTDPSGAGVPHARIILRKSSSVITTATTDELGRFQLSAAPGRYRLEVNAGKAFAALRRDVTIGPGTVPLALSVAIASVQESVDVTADDAKPALDISANLDTTKVTGKMLDELPVLDQDFIAALTPFLDPASVATGGATIVVDGVEMKSAGVAKSAIEEIAINDDPYSAESSRPGRGRIEIMTKPGGSEYHGSLALSFRNASLATTNYFAATKPPEQRHTIEGTLTGPAGHNASFLLSFSRQIDDATSIVHALTPGGVFAENVAAPSMNTEIALRYARDFSEKHRASIQLNWKQSSNRNQRAGGLVLPEAGVNSTSREDDLVFSLRSFLSPERLNQFQVTLEFDRDPTKSVTNAPALIVRDAFTAGGAQGTILRTESGGKINDVVTLSHKAHVVKFGVQVPNLNRRVWRDQTNQAGTFSFANLDDYNAGRPYAYVIQQGPGVSSFWWREYGAFIQDQIKLSPRLQLSLGLRYDWQCCLHDSNNFGPRASIAWSPKNDSKTVVRAGAGVFYDRSGVGPVASTLLHNGAELRSYTILNPKYPNPFADGRTLADVPVDITRFASDIRVPYMLQFSTGFDRQISKSLSMSVGYRGSRAFDMFRSVDVNAPLPPDYNTVPDPRFGHIQEIRSDGRMRANALEVSLKGRVGQKISGQLQYTFSHTSNNTAGVFWFAPNPYAPVNAEWGRADQDLGHRLNILATIRAVPWMSLGIAAHFYSGLPFSETAGQDLFRTGLANARPAGVRRNTLEGAGTSDVDLRASHEITLSSSRAITLSADAFNLFNHPNFSGYVGNIRSPLFLTPTIASPGRRLQFSVGSRF